MSQRPNKPAPVVVKRPPEQRRKLPPDLEAFARSDDEKLRIRRPRVDRGLIRDPREGYTVAGVANRDARAVYDVRSVAMRALWDDGAADERALATLGQLFHDALRLELWHARRLTSFAAFAEEVVGVPAERAEALADEAAQRTGEPVTPLTEVAIALWLRTEAGLYEGDEGGRARVRSGDNGLVLELVVDLQEASTALAGVGARHLPLARSTPQREEARGSRDDSRGSHEDRRPYEEPRAARAAQVERTREAPRPAAPAEPDYEEDALHEEPLASELPETSDEPALESALDEAGVESDALEAEHAADEVADEGEEAGVASDEGDDGDEGDDDDAPERVVGGARLLTRKPQLPREDSAAAAVEGGEHWGRREPRGERPGVAGASPGERPKFGADRGGSPRDRGERPKFGADRGGSPRDRGERPKFGADRGGSPRDRGGERPKFAGNDRSGGGERPRFGGGNDRTGGGERPRFGGNDRGGERPRPGGFGQAGERPKFAGNDRSGGGERPRFGGGNDRSGGERPRFGGGNDRSGGGERPRFGGAEKPARAGGFTLAHDRSGGGERPRFGGGNDRGAGGERPRFGGGNDRSGGGERPRFGGGNDRSGGAERPRFVGANERGNDRPRFGNDKPQRAGGFVQGPSPKSAGEKRAPGKGFGARQSFSGNAPTGGDRDPTRSSNGADSAPERPRARFDRDGEE